MPKFKTLFYWPLKILKIKVMGRFVLRKQQSIVIKRLIFLKQDLLKGGVHQFPSRFIEIPSRWENLKLARTQARICLYSGGPVFVYNWPKSSKPFYMRACEEVSVILQLAAAQNNSCPRLLWLDQGSDELLTVSSLPFFKVSVLLKRLFLKS